MKTFQNKIDDEVDFINQGIQEGLINDPYELRHAIHESCPILWRQIRPLPQVEYEELLEQFGVKMEL